MIGQTLLDDTLDRIIFKVYEKRYNKYRAALIVQNMNRPHYDPYSIRDWLLWKNGRLRRIDVLFV